MSRYRAQGSAMPWTRPCFIMALAAALLPPHLGAQDARSGAPSRPVVILITGGQVQDEEIEVPAALDAVHRDDVRRAQPRIHLSESLDAVPGVVARDRQNYAQDLQISIRGFGARSSFGVRGVRLYTDGIPATMPDGQGQVAHFVLDAADRIEVLRGPFSALYGNSSGGVIELFTGDADRAVLEGGYLLGDFGLRRAALSFRSPWGPPQDGSVLADLTEVDSDGYRRHSAAQRRNGQLVVKGVSAGGARYSLLYNGLDLDAQDPQGLTAAQLAEDPRAASTGALLFDTRKTVRQNQLGARLEQRLSARHAAALTGYVGRRHTRQMLSVPVAAQQNPLHSGGAIELDRDYFGGDARWRWSPRGAFALTSGIQYEVADDLRRGYENFVGDRLGVFGALRRDERNRVTGTDYYAQTEWTPHARWRFDLGARYSRVRFRSDDRYVTSDNPDDSGTLEYARISPVAGMLYRATPRLSLYANAGRGFETPTSTELAYRSDGRSGLNDTLAAARSWNLELGLRATGEGVKYSLAAFHSRTQGELVVVANEGGRSIYDNAGVSRRRGVEAALAQELSPRWRYAVAYTLLAARYRTDFSYCAEPPCAEDVLIAQGRRIPGLARHTLWAELVWSPLRATELSLEGRYVDRVYADDANDAWAPAYASFDLAADRRIVSGEWEWRGFARLNNLIDRDVVGSVIVNESNGRYFEPAPGRNWVVGVSLSRELK